MTRFSVAPETLAAITNSSLRSESSCPRTTRASPGQLMSERIKVIAKKTL